MASASEDELWVQTVEVLRQGIASQQPDGIEKVKMQIRKLDAEISAIAIRREIVARGLRDGREITSSLEIVLERNLARLNARMADLRRLLANVNRVMLPDAPGPTPETAKQPRWSGLLWLAEGLRVAAVELRCGWMVRQPAAQKVKAADLERVGGPSAGEYGAVAALLESRYLGWRREMARLKAPVWPTEAVVMEDGDCWHVSRLRRTDSEVVRLLVQCGLTVYCSEFPDRLPQPE